MWTDSFDERQRKEIEFAKLYADRFSHGTDGHNAKVIIAKMAAMLDKIEAALNPVTPSPYFSSGGVSLRSTPPPYLRWVDGDPADESPPGEFYRRRKAWEDDDDDETDW